MNAKAAITSRPAPSFLPSTAVLEMTYRCNHRCLYCSCPWEAPAGTFERLPEMSADRWKDVIARLASMGCSSIAFTGGEPLLKDGIEDIIAFAAGCEAEHVETVDGELKSEIRAPKLYLLSNGTEMRDDILDLCLEHDVQLSMSLPGLTTFRNHTRAGDPDTILGWFAEARRRGVKTVVNVTVTDLNLFELYETISAAFLAGADQLLMNRFLPGGRGLAHRNELMLDAHGVQEMLNTAEEVLARARRQGSVGTELPKCAFDPERYERLHVGTRCSAAISFFVVGPSGYIRTCNHSPRRLAHVDDIEKVKTDPYWMSFTQKKYLPPSCRPCPMSNACDGGCREAAHICGGCLDALDPLMADGAPDDAI